MTEQDITAIIRLACDEAYKAAETSYARNGDRDACGFAWVYLREYNGKPLDGRSRVGRLLKKAGVKQVHTRMFQIWNPSRFPTQSINILEDGARAAARVFNEHGFTASAGSRMD